MAKKKNNESILKHVTFGVEYELFTLDKEGRMINGAGRLIEKVRETNPDIDIVRECGENMVEIRSLPDAKIPSVMEKTLADFEAVLHSAEKEGIVLYFYGTYPGFFTPAISNKPEYLVKQRIFGKKRFDIAARCIGMHCHYSLPRGVFDFTNKILKFLPYSRNKNVLEDMYNLFIAMDPALTTFCQSSPFYEGKYIGKDSRVIVYRGGKILNYTEGLYSNHQEFGALQPYKLTGMDLPDLVEMQFELWNKIIDKIDINFTTMIKYGSILDTHWNPVRINAHGTMEQRGMDMNSPRISVAVATLVKAISKAVHEKFIQVVPSNIGRTEPFRLEGNRIFIPHHHHVRHVLQPKAAYLGLEDKDVEAYCSGLLYLGKEFIPKNERPLIEPLESMLEKKKTVSDEIILEAKKIGIDGFSKMSNEQAQSLALNLSKDFFKEIILTKQALAQVGKNSQ